jgi:glycosyltransferase involved in cell wall biosynthesis
MRSSGGEAPPGYAGGAVGRRIACYRVGQPRRGQHALGQLPVAAGAGQARHRRGPVRLARAPAPAHRTAARVHLSGLLAAAPPAGGRFLPTLISRGLKRGYPTALDAAWRRTYEPVVSTEHARAPYAAVLALGARSPFRLPGVPTITWVQGGLSTELDAIRRLRRQVVAGSGWPFYLALTAAYRAGDRLERKALSRSDRIIVGSEWSRRTFLDGGFDPERVHAVPYAVDLQTFSPSATAPAPGAPQIVALGRLDPRKRLDLLLDAFRLVLLDHPHATLRIVGRAGMRIAGPP